MLRFKGSVWRATLDTKKLLVHRLERMRSNNVELKADFGDFTTGKYGWLLRRFDIRSADGGWRTVVRIDRIEINPFLVEKNFKLETTFSAKIEKCR